MAGTAPALSRAQRPGERERQDPRHRERETVHAVRREHVPVAPCHRGRGAQGEQVARLDGHGLEAHHEVLGDARARERHDTQGGERTMAARQKEQDRQQAEHERELEQRRAGRHRPDRVIGRHLEREHGADGREGDQSERPPVRMAGRTHMRGDHGGRALEGRTAHEHRGEHEPRHGVVIHHAERGQRRDEHRRRQEHAAPHHARLEQVRAVIARTAYTREQRGCHAERRRDRDHRRNHVQCTSQPSTRRMAPRGAARTAARTPTDGAPIPHSAP